MTNRRRSATTRSVPAQTREQLLETIKDGLAEVGMTDDDVRELIQKLAGSDKRH
jgi:hypothetical protein